MYEEEGDMGERWFNPSPWARRALGDGDEAAIRERAVELGARVTAVGGPSTLGPWTVHATSVPGGGIREGVYHARGLLAVVVSGVLDRFSDQRDIVAEEIDDLFTPEEILTIAHQSGLVA